MLYCTYCIVLYCIVYVAGQIEPNHVNLFPNQVNLSQPRSICLKLDQLVSCYCRSTCLITKIILGQVKNMGHKSLFANTGIILNIRYS